MATDYAPLFYWVREREAIRCRKEDARKLPRPWTTDPILAKFRFCNVRREDDSVTRWIDARIRKPYAGHPHLWLMLCIARQINWPDTLAALITEGAWPNVDGDWITDMERCLHARQQLRLKVYTGAYTITAPPTKGTAKIPFTCQTVIGQLWRDREKFAKHFVSPNYNIQNTHALLKTYTAWGEFMAYQAVGDMIFTDILRNAPDRELWCAAGPGTIRGLNRLHGRPVKYGLDQATARSEIRKLYTVIYRETGVRVEFNDVPNCLCETDKYLRVKNGEGEPRALYVPAEKEAA